VVGNSIAVPISFDVALRIDGQTIPSGRYFAGKTQKGIMSSGEIETTPIPDMNAAIKHADVVLTPNPKWIELQPGVDRIWGKEIVFRNVPLRRLQAAEPPLNENEIPLKSDRGS
jgi:hypothetical protein